ncbi:MAG: hypothetical protein J5I59_05540 [Saprospiraceae bacterium]|nr:hypothetical protein [Saprospiraceae bacterium]
MVELSEFLIDLIFRQKSANIPELGSFKFETSPARMNFGENLIYPPTQQLVFSESTSDDDEVSLLDFLVKEKGFDRHEADIWIKAYVHRIREELTSTGFYYIPGLGTLHRTEGSAIHFTPGDKIKAMKPTMGLPELSVTPIQHEYAKQEGTADVAGPNTFVETRPGKSPQNQWILPLILSFVLLGLGLIGYFLYKNQYKTAESLPPATAPVNQDSLLLAHNGFEQATDSTDSITDETAIINEINHTDTETSQTYDDYQPDDAIVANSATAPEEANQSTQTKSTTITTSTSSSSSDGKVCAVIVGVMANPNNAKRLARTVKKAGFEPFSYISKGLTRVGAACGCDAASIESTLAAMKKINADAWVYESK